jgi:hypothetical protein
MGISILFKELGAAGLVYTTSIDPDILPAITCSESRALCDLLKTSLLLALIILQLLEGDLPLGPCMGEDCIIWRIAALELFKSYRGRVQETHLSGIESSLLVRVLGSLIDTATKYRYFDPRLNISRLAIN